MSLRLRLALLSGFAVFAVVALFGTGVYFVLSQELYGQVDTGLGHYASAIQRRINISQRRPSRVATSQLRSEPAEPSHLLQTLSDDPYTFATVYLANDRVWASNNVPYPSPVKVPDRVLDAALKGFTTSFTASAANTRYRLRVAQVVMPRHLTGAVGIKRAPPGGTAMVLVVGESLSDVDYTLAILRWILIGGGAIALGSAGLLGWLVAGRSLQPIFSLSRAAEEISMSGDPALRLPSPRIQDEVGRLSTAFNASLDRLETVYRALEEALQQQRRFAADASHELRTPLTVILNNAENLRDHPEIRPEERREYLEEVVYEAKRLAGISADLVQLARGDAGAPLEIEEVNWDAFVAEIGHDAIRICAPRKVLVDAPQLLGTGAADEAALRRTFRVFFDNITRHTPRRAAVNIVASSSSDELRLTVSDSGPGVPSEALPRIFERFFRADTPRQGHGAGLGLAIAKSVIERHHGELTAHNHRPHGLVIDVRIPRTQVTVSQSRPSQSLPS